jgi:phosphoglycolate phosphatase
LAKIQYYQLAPYVDFNRSVYGDLSEDREELARILYARLLGEQCITSPGDLVVVGDTVHDARCAAAIGAPCIIVLAGSVYKREDFAGLNTWKIIDALPADPADFVRLLNSAVVKA